jgi:hypothetical protein
MAPGSAADTRRVSLTTPSASVSAGAVQMAVLRMALQASAPQPAATPTEAVAQAFTGTQTLDAVEGTASRIDVYA